MLRWKRVEISAGALLLGAALYYLDEQVLLQKTFTADYLTKRRVKNSGQQKPYYVKNHHEACLLYTSSCICMRKG